MQHNRCRLSHCQVPTISLQHVVSQFYQEENFLGVATLGRLLNWGQGNRVCFLQDLNVISRDHINVNLPTVNRPSILQPPMDVMTTGMVSANSPSKTLQP